MRIKTIESSHRRDFHATYECEHCGATKRSHGYDDANFHDNVVPAMVCAECGRTAAADYQPLTPKYGEGEIV